MPMKTRRYANNPAFQITLNSEQLRDLGILFAVWGQIDFQIVFVIAQILRIEPKAAVSLLDNVTSGTLIGHLRKQLNEVTDPETHRELKGFCSRMGALIEKRNHLSHGIWGWNLSQDQKTARPACHYGRANESPIFADELADLLRRVMAESHTIKTIQHRYLGMPPSVEDENPPPFFFGALGGNKPADWLLKAPLQPGMGHQLTDQN